MAWPPRFVEELSECEQAALSHVCKTYNDFLAEVTAVENTYRVMCALVEQLKEQRDRAATKFLEVRSHANICMNAALAKTGQLKDGISRSCQTNAS
jgi:hypothetical protein